MFKFPRIAAVASCLIAGSATQAQNKESVSPQKLQKPQDKEPKSTKAETPKPAPTPEESRKAVEALMLSKNPRVAAAAKELYAQMTRSESPPLANPPGVKLELKAEPKTGELKIEGMVLVMNVGGGESSLKMSADGKKAAVIGADGSVTVYEVATGNELMKFPAKK